MKNPLATPIKMLSIFALLSLLGCTTAPVVPTADPQVFASTVSAAQTEAVQSVYTRLTQAVTSTQPPTNTPQPTETTTATSIPPTLVPTRTFVVTQAPTLSPTQTAFQCSITSLAPTSGTNLPKGTDFDLAVSLKNTGTEAWSSNVIDFKYISGSKFQKKVDMIDLPADVAPGGSINLVIDMTAGTDAGSLNTTWELSQSNALFCPVSMYVYVQ